MTPANAVLREIERLVNVYKGQKITEVELINAFFVKVMESELAAAEPCLSILPDSSRDFVRRLLNEMAAADYPYNHHIDRSHPRPEHWERMRPHYRQVGLLLLSKLQ